MLDWLFIATDHHAVTLLETPYAARRSAIHVLKALGRDLAVAADRVFVIGVAAVDDDVARGEQRFERGNGVIHRLAGRDHHPHSTRRRKLRDHVGQARGAGIAGGGEFGDSVGAEVEPDHLVARVVNALRHEAAHLA